jgi:CheY-like chemotaxis protein
MTREMLVLASRLRGMRDTIGCQATGAVKPPFDCRRPTENSRMNSVDCIELLLHLETGKMHCNTGKPVTAVSGMRMRMSSTDPLILIIDDELSTRRRLRAVLRSQGYRLAEAVAGHEGLAQVALLRPDLIILKDEGRERLRRSEPPRLSSQKMHSKSICRQGV